MSSFRKTVIIGVGQLGASVGLNLVGKRLAREVVGIGRTRANLRTALKRKAIHRAVGAQFIAPLLANLSTNDLIVLAVPVAAIRESMRSLPKGPLILDVGSAKSAIMKEAERRRLRFVGSHPIAGTEKGGASAGRRDLFQGRLCVVTPSRGASKNDVKKVETLWRRFGAKTVRMPAVEHDRILAMTSHLPHALAFSLSRFAAHYLSRRQRPFVFTSFKDATRVALSPVEMWRDIFLENREEVLRALQGVLREIESLGALVSSKDGKGLKAFLDRAQKFRRGFQ